MPSIDDVASEIDAALETASDDEKGGYERLKNEVKRYRERFKTFEEMDKNLDGALDVIASLPEGDQRAIFGFASQYAQGMESGDFGAAAETAVAFGRSLAGDAFDELVGAKPVDEPAETPETVEDEMAGLDENSVKKMLAEMREELKAELRQEQQSAEQIRRNLTELGYEPDPNDARTRAVLSLAAANEIDLSEADAMLKSILGDPGGSPDESEAAGAAGESAGADEQITTAPPEGVPTGGSVDPPKTFEEAGERAEARLASLSDAEGLS